MAWHSRLSDKRCSIKVAQVCTYFDGKMMKQKEHSRRENLIAKPPRKDDFVVMIFINIESQHFFHPSHLTVSIKPPIAPHRLYDQIPITSSNPLKYFSLPTPLKNALPASLFLCQSCSDMVDTCAHICA